MQNEMTLCGILIGVMAFFMILGMIGIQREKKMMRESENAQEEQNS